MREDLDGGAAWEARKALRRRGVGARLSVAADGTTTPEGAALRIAMERAVAHPSSFRVTAPSPRSWYAPTVSLGDIPFVQTAESQPRPSNQFSIASPR